MKNLETTISELNLIYYTYDKTNNKLLKDIGSDKDGCGREKIKITYTLATKKIDFFIDEEESIIIGSKDTLQKRIKRFLKSQIDSFKNNKRNIYILSDKKVKWAKNLPIISINYMTSNIDLSIYDALIFTSKNAIIGIDKSSSLWKSIPSYVIAPQTAKFLKASKGNLAFVSKTNHGNEFAEELIPILQNKKVLYIKGKDLVSNTTEILKQNNISCDELIVYETTCKQYDPKPSLPKNSVIIFSSPSTIKCFFKNNLWDESFQAIAIGSTTAKYFPPHIKPIISDNTSLEFCVKKAIEILD